MSVYHLHEATKKHVQNSCEWPKKEIFFPDDILTLPIKFCSDEFQAKMFHAIRCCETLGHFSNIKIECFENLCIVFLGSVLCMSPIPTKNPCRVIAEYCCSRSELKTMHSTAFWTLCSEHTAPECKNSETNFITLFILAVLHRTITYQY